MRKDANIVEVLKAQTEKYPTCEKICSTCGRTNHFHKVCMQRERKRKSLGTWILLTQCFPPKISATMKFKSGLEVDFQVDTGTAVMRCWGLSREQNIWTEWCQPIQFSRFTMRESLWPHGKCKVQLVNPVDRKMNVVSIWLGVDAINYNSEWKDQDFVPRSNWTCVHRESEREPNKLPNFRWIGIALSSGMCCLFDGLGSLATPLQLEVDKDDPFSSHWDEFLKLWENHWKSTLMILKLRLS